MFGNKLILFLKGMCVGGTMLVPGVSGGSMAMILGVYDKLISSVNSLKKDFARNTLFLGIFALGGMIGILLFAKPLLTLIERHPMPTLYFFIGAVAGGVPMIYKKAELSRFTWSGVVYPLLGLILIFLLGMLPANLFSAQGAGLAHTLFLFVTGIIVAVALVLPGISVSYMLLLLGMYDQTMRAITELYLPYLLPLGFGLIAGILLTTSILEKAMTQYPKPTYLIILGFIVGSVVKIFPGFPSISEFLICGFMLVAGFMCIYTLSKQEDQPSK
ncbi:MAG: DUF368 domain-containing protein [Cellulosilyticaceae bacterium]